MCLGGNYSITEGAESTCNPGLLADCSGSPGLQFGITIGKGLGISGIGCWFTAFHRLYRSHSMSIFLFSFAETKAPIWSYQVELGIGTALSRVRDSSIVVP